MQRIKVATLNFLSIQSAKFHNFKLINIYNGKVRFDKIKGLEKIYRLNLINSCTGYKSANLIGSIDKEGIQILQSLVHNSFRK